MAIETKTTMTREERMATQPIGRLMAKYAVPCVISLLVAVICVALRE